MSGEARVTGAAHDRRPEQNRGRVDSVARGETAPLRSRLVRWRNQTARLRSRFLVLLLSMPLVLSGLIPACSSSVSSARSAGATRSSELLGSLDTVLSSRDAGAEGARSSSPRDVIVSEEDWTYAGRSGRVIVTPHFRLHTTLGPSLLADRFPRFVEIALAAYRSDLGDLPEPARRLDTFVMKSRAEWESLTRQLTGPRASVYLRIPRGGYAIGGKGVFYDIGPYDTLAIAGHEGWHQYTQSTFGQPLPLWLEEGVATYFEGFRWHPADRNLPIFLPWSNPERFDTLRKLAARDRLMPLDKLLVSRPQDLIRSADGRTLAYYAQVWALTHFLHEGAGARYRGDLARLLSDAAAGRLAGTLADALGPREARRAMSRRVGDAVFRVYFNDDLAAAQAEYTRFIHAVTLPGTRHNITAGRSPIAGGG